MNANLTTIEAHAGALHRAAHPTLQAGTGSPAPGANQLEPGTVWVGFLLPLETPVPVAQGAVVPLRREQYADLLRQALAAGVEAVVDLTPQALPYALAQARVLRREGGVAALQKHLCGTCGTRQGAAFTVCPECGDARFVWLPGGTEPTLGRRAGLRFQLAVRLALCWLAGAYRDCPTLDAFEAKLTTPEK